uniref:Syntaxin N-terminal domain-containing protein n=1 Tax=Physcomitrium patens TaxID=3218 RepID=A0A7I4DX93_PHYPA
MSFRDIEAGGLPSGPMLQDSTQALASIVFQINTAVSSFKRLVNSLVTDIDTPVLREKLQPTPVVDKLVKETGSKWKVASGHDHNRLVY